MQENLSKIDGKEFQPPSLKKKNIYDEHDTDKQVDIHIQKVLVPVSVDDLYYNLTDGRIKHAIIFNHIHFEGKFIDGTPMPRDSTIKDGERLQKCLENLGFFVDSHDDASKEKIENVIKDATLLDKSKINCLMIFVMTHGNENDILYAKDTFYERSILVDPFYNETCNLAGVPKLFFIQACRGDQLDAGRTYTDGDDDSGSSKKIPTHADVLIMNSTMPNHFSFRDKERGSWFVQSLCEQLEDNYKKWDLLQLLTFVNRRVAFDFTSKTTDKITNNKKCTPIFQSTLTKLIKFTLKSEIDDKFMGKSTPV